jgi:hypothetical protein
VYHGFGGMYHGLSMLFMNAAYVRWISNNNIKVVSAVFVSLSSEFSGAMRFALTHPHQLLATNQ